VKDWKAVRQFKALYYTPYSPELVPADFFMLSKLKNHLPGKTQAQETSKKEQKGAPTSSPPPTPPLPSGEVTGVLQTVSLNCQKLC
jgi:hypothetical protein